MFSIIVTWLVHKYGPLASERAATLCWSVWPLIKCRREPPWNAAEWPHGFAAKKKSNNWAKSALNKNTAGVTMQPHEESEWRGGWCKQAQQVINCTVWKPLFIFTVTNHFRRHPPPQKKKSHIQRISRAAVICATAACHWTRERIPHCSPLTVGGARCDTEGGMCCAVRWSYTPTDVFNNSCKKDNKKKQEQLDYGKKWREWTMQKGVSSVVSTQAECIQDKLILRSARGGRGKSVGGLTLAQSFTLVGNSSFSSPHHNSFAVTHYVAPVDCEPELRCCDRMNLSVFYHSRSSVFIHTRHCAATHKCASDMFHLH